MEGNKKKAGSKEGDQIESVKLNWACADTGRYTLGSYRPISIKSSCLRVELAKNSLYRTLYMMSS